MKKHKKTKPTGFKKYVITEKMLLKILSEDMLSFGNQTQGSGNVPLFAESFGACQLFSAPEAARFYLNAKSIFGNEIAKYAQIKIKVAFRCGNRRALAKAPKVATIMQLRESYPNFGEVLDVVEGASALSHLSDNGYLHISPLLLLGESGIGKTAFVQTLSKLIGVNFIRIDIGTSSSAAILAGLSLTWGSGRCGEIFNLLTESEFMNPIIMLDEIDKAVGNYAAPIEPILLSLLEPESASTFRDEAIQLKMNASKIIWIATANDIERISAPLLSRFTVIEIKQPDNEQAKKIVCNIYRNIKNANTWGGRFEDELNDEVVDKLSKITPRVASKMLHQAFGKAAINHRHKILVTDIPDVEIKKSMSIGFI